MVRVENRVMKTNELSIERRTLGEITILDCAGRIVVRRETDLLFDAVAFAIEHSRSVLLNLAGVTAIDSGGLGTLVLLKQMAKTFSCDLRLCVATGRVREMITLTHLNKTIPLHPTEDDALLSYIGEIGKAATRPQRFFTAKLRYSAA